MSFTRYRYFLTEFMKVFQKVRLLNYRIAGNFCGVFISAILRFLSATAELTSILRVLLKAIQSPTDPNKFKSATIISPSKIQKMNFEQRAITHEKVGQPWRKSNLICNSSYGSLLLTFSQICESIAKKSPGKRILNGNNSWESRSTVTKVELDL